MTLLGVLTLCFGFVIGAETLISWWRETAASGFATLIFTILVVGSFIGISLGIIGEYIAKIYEKIKRRPTYLIKSTAGFDESYAHRDTSGGAPGHHRQRSDP